jgi:hypothetical protein
MNSDPKMLPSIELSLSKEADGELSLVQLRKRLETCGAHNDDSLTRTFRTFGWPPHPGKCHAPFENTFTPPFEKNGSVDVVKS